MPHQVYKQENPRYPQNPYLNIKPTRQGVFFNSSRSFLKNLLMFYPKLLDEFGETPGLEKYKVAKQPSQVSRKHN